MSPSVRTPLDTLFRPFTVGSLDLANRIVMAPMTREFSPGGVPGPDVAEYYARRARHGVGLIVTEPADVDHPASWGARPAVPRFYGADALAGWAEVVRRVHREGGRIVPQLWHVGMERESGRGDHPAPVGPSMTETEILGVIDSFGRAAADAHALGFDGIELHAAHGYLIDQFFRAVTNDRTDRFGGDLVRRTRFAAEVVRACRRATAPDFPIILRFSQWREADYGDRLATDPAELDLFLTALAGAGVDLFHCSTRRFWLPEFDGSDLNLAGWTRKLTGLPTITVGSVGRNSDLGRLIDMMDRGDFDLVAVGRALLADPAWAEKVRHGREADLVEFQPELIDTLY